jgi:prepilin-type N-terminal cleavage/methylation domain-containing protein
MNRTHSQHRRRRGFSLVEVMVSTGLVVMLSVLLSNAWTWLGRPLLQTAARCSIAREADLALDCLARDLGGSLPESISGVLMADQFVGWAYPDGNALQLCFDSSSNPNGVADWAVPDTVILYQVTGNSLIRSNQLTGVDYVVAQNVASLNVQDPSGDLEIVLSFAYRGVSLSYTLVAKHP